MAELSSLTERMNEEGFWLSGWGPGRGAFRTPAGTADGGVAQSPPPATGGAAAPAPQTGVAGGATAPAGDPRSQAAGIEAPRYQIRTLYAATRVLAERGDQEGCQHLVAEMNEIYDGYSQQLQEAGVDPAAVTTWRQEQLALAEPVGELDSLSSYSLDNLTGTDVRNPNDERLGSVNDVVIDAQSGQGAYLIIARGGFLGLGEDYYAIPWDEVRVTPGLDTVVVNRTEQEIEQAPSVDPDRFRNPETREEERQATDEYWSQ